MANAPIETDYLIVGAGAASLAFADEFLSRSDAHMTIVDTRHAPGGHWNDAYGFVRLHQPSAFYGVGSRELGDQWIEETGPNAGYLSLATGAQVTGYFHAVMNERLLPSGRVTFVPMHRFNEDNTITSLMSGEVRPVTVRKKTVNGAYMTNQVPKTHTRKFDVADGVTCVPPNDLPALASTHDHFTVIGAGKTGMDACIWLLQNGVDQARIRWIIPRDSWLWNRATTQPHPDFFHDVYGSFLGRQKAIAEATSPQDMARRFEACGMWLRIDPDHEPTVYRGATVSEREVDMLASIEDKVRLGRVSEIRPGELVLAQGTLPAPDDTLYIDSTAKPFDAGVAPAIPVFNGDRITLQMVRFPQIAFSSAMIAYLETKFETDAEKNRLAAPVEVDETLEGFVRGQIVDFANRMNANGDKELRDWILNSRLDGFTRMAVDVDKTDEAKMAILSEMRSASMAAAMNLPKLAGLA
ncbi:MAG: FAD/NAD(P)-binding protein [Pseudomonadota bacterium]